MSAPAAPTISPAPDAGQSYASFSNSVSVTITTGGTTIYYTTDGSDPRSSPTAQVYGGAFTLLTNTQVQAVAIGSNLIGPVAVQDFILRG